MRVLGISGSLRADSHNTELLRAAATLLPSGVEFELYEGLREIPAYDADIEGARPEPVQRLWDALERADAVLFATPEYNHSVPGSLKNALDWVSRPVATNPLRNKPVAVVGASTGIFGAVWAQAELRKVLGALGARVVERELAVGQAAQRIAGGSVEDGELLAELGDVVSELVAAVEERRATAASAEPAAA